MRTVGQFGAAIAADLLSFGFIDELITTIERTENVLGGLNAARYMLAYKREKKKEISFKFKMHHKR